MAKLYELGTQYRKLMEFIDASWDNELEEDDLEMFIETLESVEDALGNKLDNIARFLKNIESEIEMFKAEEDRLAKRRKYLENKFKGLKQYAQGIMVNNNIEKIEAGVFRVRLQRNPPSVLILNESKIPEKYREKQPDNILKKDILADLKLKVKIEGATIAPESKHIRFS
ncbi:hypothetical protein EBB07_28525 [Paenibacillaceae bacterium]|nr:hypothetical protein EBB07_28525 [Paenibacillaceae bacterium]